MQLIRAKVPAKISVEITKDKDWKTNSADYSVACLSTFKW